MTDYFSFVVKKLAAAGIESPRLEARLMLAKVLDTTVDSVTSDVVLNDENIKMLQNFLEQRIKHRPLDKILGSKGFYKENYKVDDDVLSPRPDSEILVEEALQLIPENEKGLILDLGTGSGCLIESILAERRQMRGTAVDVSAKALQIAKQNAVNLHLNDRMVFLQADWFSADFTNNFGDKFDIVVSNPPYIPSADIATLEPEVRDYDPLKALDGGADGLDSYRRLAEVTPLILRQGGYVLLEAGIGQSRQIIEIFRAGGFKWYKTAEDLSGVERCIIMQKAVAEMKKI